MGHQPPTERPAGNRGPEHGPGGTAGDSRLLSRLGRALTRPWWEEPAEERERRWQRLALRGPLGGFVGVLFGALTVRAWGPAVLPMVFSAGAGGFLLMYLLGQLESWLHARAADGRGPPLRLVRLATDLAGGALLGWAVGEALDADGRASLVAGATFMVAFTRIASRIFWGDAVEGTVRFLTGQAGWSREPDYSREESLAARGRVDEAIESLEEACRERPGRSEPMLRAAWILREAGRWDEAIEWYRRAFWTPGLPPAGAAAVVRHVHEIATIRLGDPDRALPDLRELVARYPDAEEVAWARRELAR